MKKVIAINNDEIRVLTTFLTAEKNKWWITHHLEVSILPVTVDKPQTSTEPETGNTMESNGRFYKIDSSKKVLICTICKEHAKYKIGYRFYCKKHYKHLMLTKPIRRNITAPERNSPCSCGSGKKFKNCCITKSEHQGRHYFNSRFMEDVKIVSSLKTEIKQ
jgi:hypothetical protein